MRPILPVVLSLRVCGCWQPHSVFTSLDSEPSVAPVTRHPALRTTVNEVHTLPAFPVQGCRQVTPVNIIYVHEHCTCGVQAHLARVITRPNHRPESLGSHSYSWDWRSNGVTFRPYHHYLLIGPWCNIICVCDRIYNKLDYYVWCCGGPHTAPLLCHLWRVILEDQPCSIRIGYTTSSGKDSGHLIGQW